MYTWRAARNRDGNRGLLDRGLVEFLVLFRAPAGAFDGERVTAVDEAVEDRSRRDVGLCG